MANIRAQKLSHHLNKVTESTENLSLLQMISLKSTYMNYSRSTNH